MIERLQDLPRGVDGLSAKGRVSKEDYERVVQPLLDDARAEGRRLNLLYHFGPDFEELSLGAAWQDMRLGLRHMRLFERCAVVTDVDWIRKSSQLMATMLPFRMRVFGNDEWTEALSWLSAPVEPSALGFGLLSEVGVLVVEPSGPLKAEDFDALAASVDSWIETHGPLRGLVVKAREFPGWEDLASFLRHLRFVRDHQDRIRRVALVSDASLASLAPRLAERFVEAEVASFDFEESDKALAWAAAGPDREASRC